MTFLNVYLFFIYIYFFSDIYIYIAMFKHLSVKYYQENKERLQKIARER